MRREHLSQEERYAITEGRNSEICEHSLPLVRRRCDDNLVRVTRPDAGWLGCRSAPKPGRTCTVPTALADDAAPCWS